MRLKALVEVSHAIPKGREFESGDLGIDDEAAGILVALGHLAEGKARPAAAPRATQAPRASRAQTKALTTDTGRPGEPEAVQTDEPF